MITLKRLREETERVIACLERRGLVVKESIDTILDKDALRRDTQTRLEEVQRDVNKLSKEFGAMMASGQKAAAESLRASVQELKDKAKSLETSLEEIEKFVQEQLVLLPNVPHTSVPTYGGRKAQG